jgi:hypothetical protein
MGRKSHNTTITLAEFTDTRFSIAWENNIVWKALQMAAIKKPKQYL